ncbi:hypothetical protein [Pseudomonas marginalis]|jgi:hypothetical protein|uniref:hypothetical protein n=1 Tax=Pseudomonas marginalis TaxID=298 RepID=UPI003BA129F0
MYLLHFSAVLRKGFNPFVGEVFIEVLVESDAGNQITKLSELSVLPPKGRRIGVLAAFNTGFES